MKPLVHLVFFLVALHCSYAPPVSPEKAEHDSEIKDDLEEYMEYHRYLKEVVHALESDPEFRERLEKADEEDVRSGKIAEQLNFVDHNIRTKLDEIKRRELDRLRHLATKQFELTNSIDTNSNKQMTLEHLDHNNPHTFEIEDLKRLIKKTTADLEIADKQRKEQFKEYEMQKEFEKHQKLEAMDEAQKKEYEEKLKKAEESKKHHKPLHHPGSKPQLEEVWEKQDHMDQQFNPKAFFMMHDVDGNGVWDADEVKALFIKELDKIYGPEGPNKDMHERAEEMERMREHVFQETDVNRDGLIDYNEFIRETQKEEFNRDEGWKTIDENQIYTSNEYQEFERRRLEELKYLQQRGLVDARGNMVPGVTEHKIAAAIRDFQVQQQQAMYQQHGLPHYYPQGMVHPQDFQQPAFQAQYPPQGQFQGQQPPQGQFQGQQIPQGQFQGQQVPQGQFQGQQVPQGQFQGQQVPQGQYQGQQVPQGQYQGQQVSQGQYQGQQPAQGQFQGQQVPQGQFQGQQVPQAQYQGQQPPQASQGQLQGQQSQQGQQPAQGQVQQQPPQGYQQGQGIPSQPQVQNQPQQAQNQPRPAEQQGQMPPVQANLSPVQGQNSIPAQVNLASKI